MKSKNSDIQFGIKKIKDVTDIIFSGGTPSTKIKNYWNGKIPWLSSGETRNDFIVETEKTITEQGVENSSTRLAKQHDILVASAGQGNTRGQVSFCLIDTFINQSIIALRTKNTIMEPTFLYYNLKSRYPELRRISDSFSSRGSLTTKLLADLEILVPPLQQQKKVSKILYLLDMKILTIKKQNQTLEKIIQSLFKSWFIDFEGQTEFDDSELGEIPKGWKVMSLGDIVDFHYGKALKEELRQEGIIPVYGSNGLIGWHNKALVKGPGIIIGRKGSPGIVTLSMTDFFPIDTTFYIATKSQIKSIYFLFNTLVNQNLPLLVSDTAVPGLNRTIAYRNKILVPSPQLIEIFDGYANLLYNMINMKQKVSTILVKMRDLLLPKLISGEIIL